MVGRAGIVIIDDVAELDEFEDGPWASDQVAGEITFEGLQQSAGRRAILRDRDAFPAFVMAVRSIEPAVSAALEKVRREVDQQTADRMSDAVRRIFGRVLRELDDLDNPMRSAVGNEPGSGGLFAADPGAGDGGDGGDGASPDDPLPPRPNAAPGSGWPDDPDRPEGRNDDDLPPDDTPRPIHDEPPPVTPAAPKRAGGSRLPTVAVDPEPGEARSRFDPDEGVVYYSDRHSDYLLVKDEESSLLDYLATLVAKEYVVYNNPRASSSEFAEEMVRMLVRVRRHLRRR